MNRQVLVIGAVLFLGAAVFQAVVQGSRGFDTDPLDGFFGLAMLVGLILIIVGALKSADGRAAHQQQQQQVVVYTGGPGQSAPGAPRMILDCATCNTANEASARYCMECGHELRPTRAPPSRRAGTSSSRRKA
jgi:hypothetical protein